MIQAIQHTDNRNIRTWHSVCSCLSRPGPLAGGPMPHESPHRLRLRSHNPFLCVGRPVQRDHGAELVLLRLVMVHHHYRGQWAAGCRHLDRCTYRGRQIVTYCITVLLEGMGSPTPPSHHPTRVRTRMRTRVRTACASVRRF
jgi:hypothetical protein